MQHDDSASLTMKGVLLSAAGGSTLPGSLSTAKVTCAEAALAPGWHDIAIQYASKAGQARHHLRMSLHSPLLVEERYPRRFIVHYENAGVLTCTQATFNVCLCHCRCAGFVRPPCMRGAADMRCSALLSLRVHGTSPDGCHSATEHGSLHAWIYHGSIAGVKYTEDVESVTGDAQ